jgi:signal transduction histidine kinase
MLSRMHLDIASRAVARRETRSLARAGWAAAVVLTAAVAVLAVLGSPGGSRERVLDVVWAAVWIGSGALVLMRATPSRVSVLVGTMLLGNGVATPLEHATAGTSGAVLGRTVLGVALTLSVLTLSVFPDGRFVPPWLRLVCVGFAGWQIVVVVGTSGTVLDVLGGVVYFVGFGIPVAAQVRRYRHEPDPVQRARTKWVVYGVCAFLAVTLTVSLPYFAPGWFPDLVRAGSSYDDFQSVVGVLAVLAIPICLTIAMLVGGLFDVDVVISRTLVYGALSVAVAAGYLGLVGVAGLLAGRPGTRVAPLAAAAVVAVLIGPLRAWLQVRVRRLVYGLRDEPYAALRDLGRELATSAPDDDVPARLVSTVRRSLRAPYVAVAVGDETGFPVAAESGLPAQHRLTLPLLHRGEQVGMLLVGYDDRHRLSAADRSLLVDLSRQAGGAIRAVQLTRSLQQNAAQLQQARERLVLTREEERRRLRRDLHDGLAPTLAAAGLTAATAADLAERDPGRAGALIGSVQDTLQTAVGDIRAMVDELRPPALDELGLVQALRERATELRQGMTVEVLAPDGLPELPAAVEVAAYRICQEALMNVLKHSGARTARVTLGTSGGLTMVVEDDGVGVDGIDDRRTHGVGLASMRERAAELGGDCTVDETPGGGTRVSVRFPLHTSPAGIA